MCKTSKYKQLFTTPIEQIVHFVESTLGGGDRKWAVQTKNGIVIGGSI